MSWVQLTIADALPRLAANDPTLKKLRLVDAHYGSPVCDGVCYVCVLLSYPSTYLCRIAGKCGDAGVRLLGPLLATNTMLKELEYVCAVLHQ